jgi:hypothetical protein
MSDIYRGYTIVTLNADTPAEFYAAKQPNGGVAVLYAASMRVLKSRVDELIEDGEAEDFSL